MCLFIAEKTNIKLKGKDKRTIIRFKEITPESGKKAYLCASATVEASIVIPLFIYAVMMVVYLIHMESVRQSINTAMYSDIRKLSEYAYVCNQFKDNYSYKTDKNTDKTIENIIKSGLSDAVAKKILIDELGSDFAKNNGIVGGNDGISLIKSEILRSDSKIKLVVSYKIKNPFDIFGTGAVNVEESFVANAWLGEDHIQRQKGNSSEESVYITVSGKVYHKDRACTYLNVSVNPISRANIENTRNKSGGKYYPCEKCGSGNSLQLYITDYGERYHTSINCSNLKRTVIKIPLEKTDGRKPCSKCVH